MLRFRIGLRLALGRDPRLLNHFYQGCWRHICWRYASIWLCLECGRCTGACTQKVDGCLMIARLRELAAREGWVSDDFALRLRQAQQPIFMRLADEIDCLIGVPAATGSRTRSPACRPAVECV
jgi:hypothetical protein